eukprot:911849-Pyramimonas_sp.AAC.1
MRAALRRETHKKTIRPPSVKLLPQAKRPARPPDTSRGATGRSYSPNSACLKGLDLFLKPCLHLG